MRTCLIFVTKKRNRWNTLFVICGEMKEQRYHHPQYDVYFTTLLLEIALILRTALAFYTKREKDIERKEYTYV